MTTLSEDEIRFKNIIDTNLTHRGKASDVVLECLRDAGYNLKLIKIGENQEIYKDNILLKVYFGHDNNSTCATLEFKLNGYPYYIKKLLKVISQELEEIK